MSLGSSATLEVLASNLLRLDGDDISTTLLVLSAGSSSRTLSAYSVDLATRTFFVLTLNNSDETALNQFLNSNGNDSILNQTYNLTALAGYNGNRASTTRNSSITVAGIYRT